MSLEEVEQLTGNQIHPASDFGRLERYFIDKGSFTNFWLFMNAEGLESIAISRIVGLKSTRLSPIRNICTGELQFFLRLSWTEDLEEATIYLDREEVKEDDWLWPYHLELTAGEHELLVEMEGFGSGVVHLDYGSSRAILK